MTFDHLGGFLIVAVLVISAIVRAARGAKRGFDKVVEQQRADEPQKAAALQAEMVRRGITPTPALQAAIARRAGRSQTRAAAPTGSVALLPGAGGTMPWSGGAMPVTSPWQTSPDVSAAPPPVPAAPTPQRARPQPVSTPAYRSPAPITRSLDAPSAARAPLGSARRTFADAFSDPAHARQAIILAEVLAPPLALR